METIKLRDFIHYYYKYIKAGQFIIETRHGSLKVTIEENVVTTSKGKTENVVTTKPAKTANVVTTNPEKKGKRANVVTTNLTPASNVVTTSPWRVHKEPEAQTKTIKTEDIFNKYACGCVRNGSMLCKKHGRH